MRLDSQQKMIALIFGVVIILVLGAMIFITNKPETQWDKQIAGEAVPVMVTSTEGNDLSSNGWWDELPTAKPVSTMPIPSNATPTSSHE